jgi:hypothetical protein
MPQTTGYLKLKYCVGDFPKCAIYKVSSVYGPEKTPTYLYPNDIFGTDQEENDLQIKVIRADGRFDSVSANTVEGLVKSGAIVAYQRSEGWVEIRRQQSIGYKGTERRTNRLY